MQELAVRAALAHRRPGALDARDPLGADGSRRIVTSTFITHRLAPFSFFFSRVTVLCTTTAIALADSAAVCASSAFAQCVCVFFETTLVFAVISDQKSLVVVRWLPHRGRRCVGASLVELSRKTHFSVAMS